MSNDLAEALTAAGVPQLLPKIIDPMMLEYQRRFAPLVRGIPSGKYATDVFTFNRRSRNPAGGFVLDGGARPQTQSTYEQFDYKMKHLQVVGSVTGYTEEVTKQVISSLRQSEIEGSIQGLLWDIETAILWGNAAATEFGAYPQFDGFDTMVSNFSGTEKNAIDFNNGSLTLGVLDQIADMVQVHSAMNIFGSDWMFTMSPTANSRLSQLLVNQQRFVDQVTIAPGLIVPTYRNIPIMPTSFLSARSYSMGAVTTAASAGGALAAGSYRYRVSAIIARQGEIQASTSVTQAATANQQILLSFSPPTGVDGLAPILYKVYRSPVDGAADSEVLLGTVDATVGLAADGITPIVTTSIMDTGTRLQPRNGATVPANGPLAYVGGSADKKPAAAGSESIFLVPRNRDFLYRPWVRDIQPLDVFPTVASPDSLPYALTSDTVLALRAPRYIGQGARIATSLAA